MRLNGNSLGYVWIGLIIIFILVPILIIIPASFGNSGLFNFPPSEVTFKNYVNLMNDKRLLSSILLSLYIGLASTILACLVGICAALGIVKGRLPLKGALESFFLGPLIVPLVTTGIGFLIIVVPLGIIGSPISIILAHSIVISPYIVRIAIASLRYIDPVLEEAAIVHGASVGYAFFTVILPQMVPSLIFGSILSFLVSLDEFTVTIFLIKADTVTLPIRIYQYVTLDINPVVTAIGSVMVIISLITVVFLEKKFKIHKYMEL